MYKLKIIVCLDKNNSMLFNGRRQSQDSVLRSKIMEFTSGSTLRMNEYSGLQFSEYPNIEISDSFLSDALEGDFCFIENVAIPDISSIEEVYIFRWNRDYPGDQFFDLDIASHGFKRQKKEEFAGSSHKKITLEIFKRV